MRRAGPTAIAVGCLLLAGCSAHSSAATAPASTTASAGAAATGSAPPVAAASTPATSPASTSPTANAAASTTSGGPGPTAWPGYHGDQARTGAIATGPALAPATKAWSVDLGAAVRGQPVVADGRIIAATEKNRVVALDKNGKVLWSYSAGTPLTDVDSVAGCGNIDPLGITSTPVVDLSTGTVYVVAEVSDGHSSVHHQLVGLAVANGAVRISENVDPPLPSDERPEQLLQRAGLALGNGRVYVSYGGNAGDCGHYHGWVVGVNETGPPDRVSFEVAPDGEGGAIWLSGGAPALDGAGNLFVTTGNANPDPPAGGPDPKKYTESVVKLTADLKPLASYKDQIAGGDEDLATGNPVLLPGGEVFAVGKTDVGFFLSQSTLTESAAVKGICGSDPDGGPGYDPGTQKLFVPCRDGGVQVVDSAHHVLGPRLSGADSAPIVIGPAMWSVDHNAGTLSGFDTASGTKRQTVDVGADLPIFTSPSAGLGLLLVATVDGVTAFR